MNINVWKTPRSYTKPQVNVIINSSTRKWLKQKHYQHLKDVPTTFWWHITHICLLKITVQENHSVNLQRNWMSSIRPLFRGLVKLRKIVRQQKRQCVVLTHWKALWSYKNKPKVKRVPLTLDYTSSSGCEIYNFKLLSLCLYW